MINKETASILHGTDDTGADAGRHCGAAQARADGPEIAHILGVDVAGAMQHDIPFCGQVIVTGVDAFDTEGQAIPAAISSACQVKSQAALE